MQIYDNSNKKRNSAFVLTFLFPFGGLISSIIHWRELWAKDIFWLACIFMGAIQIFHPEGTSLGTEGDAGRYVLDLIDMHKNVSSYSEVSNNFFNGVTNDIFQPTLTYLVSRFTDNGHVLFFFLAIIYGFFYSRNIWYILEKLPNRLPSGLWVLIAFFFLVCPIWNINGFRMWTALHIFVYGALPFVLEGKKNKLIWSLLSILVHHSFIFPIAILIVFFVLSKILRGSKGVETFFFLFYLFSLTIKVLNYSELARVLELYLPDYYEMRIEGYMNEEMLEMRIDASQKLSAYVVILDEMKYWSMQILIVLSYLIILLRSSIDKRLISLFSFSLFFYGISNIASLVPSGGRYIIIAQMFMLSLFLLLFSNYQIKSNFRWVFSLTVIMIGIALAFDVRQGMDYYGIMLIMGNFITMFLIESNVPLISFLKQII